MNQKRRGRGSRGEQGGAGGSGGERGIYLFGLQSGPKTVGNDRPQPRPCYLQHNTKPHHSPTQKTNPTAFHKPPQQVTYRGGKSPTKNTPTKPTPSHTLRTRFLTTTRNRNSKNVAPLHRSPQEVTSTGVQEFRNNAATNQAANNNQSTSVRQRSARLTAVLLLTRKHLALHQKQSRLQLDIHVVS